MFTKTMAGRCAMLSVLLVSATSLSQAPHSPPSSFAGLEFPVIMRQNVAAGTTPVGTTIEAKLAVATLVDGVVVPQDALLSGEVTESVAKSATSPSRLSIRMDSVQWKNRSAPMVLQFTKKVYLTAWYYTVVAPSPQDSSEEPINAPLPPRRRSGAPPYSAPTYPAPNAPASQPFPGRDPNRDPNRDEQKGPTPSAPASSASQHRISMKNVESTRNHDGAVSLTSKRSNIKLDKTTTYVFAAGELTNGPG